MDQVTCCMVLQQWFTILTLLKYNRNSAMGLFCKKKQEGMYTGVSCGAFYIYWLLVIYNSPIYDGLHCFIYYIVVLGLLIVVRK